MGPDLHAHFGEDIHESSRNAKVLIKGFGKTGERNEWIENLSLIGTTGKYLFFLDHSTRNVLISPVSNVILIEKEK